MTRSILPALLVAWLCLPTLGRTNENLPPAITGSVPGVMIEGVHADSVTSTDAHSQACVTCEKCDKQCGKLAKVRDWLTYRPARAEKQCKHCCQGCNWPQLHAYLLYKCRWACDACPCDPNAKKITWNYTPECPCQPPFYSCCSKQDGTCAKGCK